MGGITMKLIKKVTMLSTLCIGVASCFSNLYAANTSKSHYEDITKYGFSANKTYRTTSGDYWFVPELRLSQETRNSKVYIVMSVNDMDMNVTVNGPSGSVGGVVRDTQYSYRYMCEVTKEGWYDVTVRARNNQTRTESIRVTMSDRDTKLELSRRYRDNACYLVINAKDDDGIKNVSVNDVSISFNSNGGETEYRIYNTGTYKVTVTDKNDHKKTESIYMNVNDTAPTLKLSKEYKSGNWYLVIKADADDKITKVTVNNKTITFPENGGTEEYRITATGTYKVVVTDKSGFTRTESIYIDLNEKDTTKPVVKVSQNYKTNNTPGWYLLIKATDDGGIASVTVNGTNVPFDASTGMAQYYVPVDGTYTIVVTDNDGNSYTTSTYAAGNAGVSNNASVNSNTYSSGNTTIVFKLNSKMWTRNGVVQEQMSTPLKSMNSRVYLPIRYAAYALGIDPESIVWDKNTRTVTIYDGTGTIKVKVGSKQMEVNGRTVAMDVAPVASGGRVMLPISQIASAFSNQNIKLDWNNQTKQLTIKK